MEKLKREKEELAKAKQPKQLNISDTPKSPKKIKVEQKKTWVIWGLFNKKEVWEKTKRSKYRKKFWL